MTDRAEKLVVGVLGSGRGSNLESILHRIGADSGYPARVGVVVTDIPGAPMLDRARRRGIPAVTVPVDGSRGRLPAEEEQAIVDVLRGYGAELVALAGFMRVLRGPLLEAYPRAIVNIHPSILPSFPGLEAWDQALRYGAKVAGCTVHFVDNGVDTGPIIGQRAVPVLEDDTPESLHARIQEQEHDLYPEVIRWIAEGRCAIEGRRVIVLPRP